MTTTTIQRLKPSIGVWRTNKYPIGGDFIRIDPLGHQISHVIRDIDPPCRGCDVEVELIGGYRVATKKANIETIDLHSA